MGRPSGIARSRILRPRNREAKPLPLGCEFYPSCWCQGLFSCVFSPFLYRPWDFISICSEFFVIVKGGGGGLLAGHGDGCCRLFPPAFSRLTSLGTSWLPLHVLVLKLVPFLPPGHFGGADGSFRPPMKPGLLRAGAPTCCSLLSRTRVCPNLPASSRSSNCWRDVRIMPPLGRGVRVSILAETTGICALESL